MSKTAKAALAKALKGAKSFTAPFKIHGDDDLTTVIHIGTAEDAKASFAGEMAKALKAGHTIVHDDGRKVWRERIVRFDVDAAKASERFEWNEDLERVRADWFEFTCLDGTTTKRHLRAVWVSYDNI